MTLRVIIVDDEPLALSLLSAILSDIEDVEIVAECNNGYAAIEAVLTHAPDVMFLDVQMPELNGFDVIAAIQSDVMPVVVFTTAFAQYAIDAFKVQAVDYVLKPLDENRIAESVDRARAAVGSNLMRQIKPDLLLALQGISDRVSADISQNKSSALIVREADRIAFLDKDEVEWIEAAGDYVCIHVDGSVRIVRQTLKDIELELASQKFQRIHRSTIINMDKVKEIVPAKKGEAFAVMRNEKRLKVSRRYGRKIRELVA